MNHCGLCNVDDFRDVGIGAMSNVGLMTTECQYCHALLFNREKDSCYRICCCKGKVAFSALMAPPQSYIHLFTQNSNQAREFRKNIRTYNNAFSFTSLGTSFDHDLASSRDGCFTFRIQGTMYHRIGPIRAANGELPVYAQIYFQDSDLEGQVNRRLDIFDHLRRDTMEVIHNTLLHHHPYVHTFKTIHERQDLYSNFMLKNVVRKYEYQEG
jgi:hypothetical protein